MRLFILLLVLIVSSCSIKKQTFICGDRECVNSKEAKKYFQENLTIEVKVKEDNKKADSFNLVYLNTESEPNNETTKQKEENVISKMLSNNEKRNIKKKIKEEEKERKRIAKLKKKQETSKKKIVNKKNSQNIFKKIKENESVKKVVVNKKTVNIKEACPIIENCDIDEIAKRLINRGKTNKYPDISLK